ncbi:MAG: hypothetical protein ABDH21_05325 [bacterium]
MKVLSISTLSSITWFCLINDYQPYFQIAVPNSHQIVLLNTVLSIIRKLEDFREIDRVFVTTGPGYYTSIRVSCLVAQTVSFLTKKELFFIDNFQAIINTYKYVFKTSSPPIPVIKIASKRYRTQINETDIETTNLNEIINIILKTKSNHKPVVLFSQITNQEKQIIPDQLEFIDMSSIYTSFLAYISCIDQMKKAENYQIKITY